VTTEALEETFDLSRAETFRDGHPFELYDRLREAGPVYRNPGCDLSPPFWVLTRHADVEAVSRDNVRFTSTRGFRIFERGGGMTALSPHIREAITSTVLTMDPPEHGNVRRPMQPHFMPSALKRLEERVDRFVAEMVASLPAGDEIEFVTRVASIVPIRTLCLMLDIPAADQDKVFDWTNRLVGTSDPEYGPTAEESNGVFEEVFDYGAALLEQRRRQPGDDLLSIVAGMFDDGSARSQAVLRGMFTLLLAAGNETTRNSLSGSIVALSRFPGQRRRLAADPSLIPQAIPELLRFVTPVIQMMRVALTDLVIAGQPIAAGERVALLYGAANRDPALFDDPHELDVTRPNAARHLAFGIGIHHCLGARIATLQLNALLRALLARFPDIRAVGEPSYLQSNFVCGIKRLVVDTGRAAEA
jgi:cytochrome P450